MISEFEQRLAEVLGAKLPAPFTGRVNVAPGEAAGAQPQIVVATSRAEPLLTELSMHRPEIVPGDLEPRSILRLKCVVDLEVRAGTSENRRQQMKGVDALLQLLGQEDFRLGKALAVTSGDPGFLIQQVQLLETNAPLNAVPGAAPTGIRLGVEGWFWPVGVAGITGDLITVIHVRGVALPIAVQPARPQLVAGGPAVELRVNIGADKTLRWDGKPVPPSPLPFGRLAFTVVLPDGKPGLGTLAGGAAGEAGVRIVLVHDGTATVTYTPPAQAVTEELVIAPENTKGGLGLELGRVTLQVKEA